MAEYVTDLGIDNYILLQDSDDYGFSQDSVFLANLANVKPSDKLLDLGCGSGVLSHLAVIKKGVTHAVGIDVQQRAIALAQKSASLNGLDDKLTYICGDIRDIKTLLPAESFDKAVCNPPYFKGGEAPATDKAQLRALSRQEGDAALDDFVKAAAYALRFGGDLFIIIKISRLAELIFSLKSAGLEPKKLTFIYPKLSKGIDAAIITARKGAKAGLITDAFVVMDEDGAYTAQYQDVYSYKKR